MSRRTADSSRGQRHGVVQDERAERLRSDPRDVETFRGANDHAGDLVEHAGVPKDVQLGPDGREGAVDRLPEQDCPFEAFRFERVWRRLDLDEACEQPTNQQSPGTTGAPALPLPSRREDARRLGAGEARR